MKGKRKKLNHPRSGVRGILNPISASTMVLVTPRLSLRVNILLAISPNARVVVGI